MGIGIWALLALVVVLAVYLLPFLVARREVMSLSNADDRYSSELRVLATGGSTAADEACASSGHAQIFRRRPEVRAMNRPAVRNVRALRTERELARARRLHQTNREQRRVAASHRALVAGALLAAAAILWLVGGLGLMPWWPAIVPTALLGVSMVGGRKASVASAAAERRERQRIAEIERELESLVGRPAVPAFVAPGTAENLGAALRAAQEPRAAQEQAVDAEQRADSQEQSPSQATQAQGDLDESAPGQEGASREDSSQEQGDRSGRTASRFAGDAGRASGEGAASDREPALRWDTGEDGSQTPPQGWHPVHVPAPTYTLVARAPRRQFEAPAEEALESESVSVPARPQSVRALATSGVEDEQDFQPIDLDKVLERRRAAGE